MKANRVVGAVVCMVCILGTIPALAGEVNGQGAVIPGGETGRSECSYSGQQDDPVADEGFFRGDRVQSWGQIPKMLRDLLTSMGVIPHPGEGCNPNGGHSEEESDQEGTPADS